MDEIGLGLIQTAANVASAGGSILSQALFGKRNEEWAREDATTAFNRQRQLLAEQRAYESPMAQMQRYIEAGLNPNLIYGQQQGSISAPSVPQAATQTSIPDAVPQGMADSLLDAQYKKALIRRLDTQNKNETALTAEEIKNKIADTWLKDCNADLLLAQSDKICDESDKLRTETQRLEQVIALGQVDVANAMMDLLKREAYIDEEWEAYAAQLGLSVNEYKYATATLSARILGVELDNKQLMSVCRINNAQAASIEKSLPFLEATYRAQKNSAVINAGILAQQYGINKNFATADHIFSYAEGVMNGAAGLMRGIGSFGFQKATKVGGFRR